LTSKALINILGTKKQKAVLFRTGSNWFTDTQATMRFGSQTCVLPPICMEHPIALLTTCLLNYYCNSLQSRYY